MKKISKNIKIKKLNNKKEKEIIKTLTLKLLKLMGIQKTKISFKPQKDKEIIYLEIDCLNPGILIGSRGEIINSLQLVIRLMFYKKTGYWQKIIVNIADYRQKREEDLKRLALNMAQKVKFSGKEENIFDLNSAERRIIHLFLEKDESITTESKGEGKNRILTIRLKEPSVEK